MQETMGRNGSSGVAKARLDRARYDQRFARVAPAMTLDERADKFGVHRATMARIQSGHAEPRIGVAIAIAAFLNTTVESLWSLPGEVA